MYFFCCFFFFNDTATTEIYTLSLHDALPISIQTTCAPPGRPASVPPTSPAPWNSAPVRRRIHRTPHSTSSPATSDRKSTRLNSSHANISYAVFCLKKKKKKNKNDEHATP